MKKSKKKKLIYEITTHRQQLPQNQVLIERSVYS